MLIVYVRNNRDLKIPNKVRKWLPANELYNLITSTHSGRKLTGG